jgi:hypothetical protein
MADHVIIQARDAIITRLKAASTAAGSRVYRVDEYQMGDIDVTSPFVVLELGDDADEVIGVGSGADASAPQILEDIALTVFVHCVAKLDGDAEKTAFNLRGQVEASLLGSLAGKTLGGLVADVRRPAGAVARNQETDQEIFQSTLQLEVLIRHLQGEPTSFTY